MTDPHNLHVKPWRHRRHQAQDRSPRPGGWPAAMGWILAAAGVANVLCMAWTYGWLYFANIFLLGELTYGGWIAHAHVVLTPFVGSLVLWLVMGPYFGGCNHLIHRNGKAAGALASSARRALSLYAATAMYVFWMTSHVAYRDVWRETIPTAACVPLPILLLISLNIPGIRRQMASWPGAPEPPQPPQTPAPAPPPPKPIEHPGWWKQWSD